MPPQESKSPRKTLAARKYVSVRAPARGRSKRVTLKQEAVYDNKVTQRLDLIQKRLGEFSSGKRKLKNFKRPRNDPFHENGDDGLWISGGGEGPSFDWDDDSSESEVELNSEESSEDEDDEEMLLELIRDPLRQEKFKGEMKKLKRLKDLVKVTNKEAREREVDNWCKLIAIVTGEIALRKCSDLCCCEKSTITIPAITLTGLQIFFISLIVGCSSMAFQVCSNDCPFFLGKLGFISKGYYPSSPVRPQFALHEDVLVLFYKMQMSGPCSKYSYCLAIQSLVQNKIEMKVGSSFFVGNRDRSQVFIDDFAGYTLLGWT